MNIPQDLPIDVIARHAQEQPDKTSFIFLEQGETETERITFADLDRRSRKIGAYLQSVSKPGERALLLYPSSIDFVTTFYGCLYAGIIPIPANPPRLNRPAIRLQAIVNDSKASLAITTTQYMNNIARRFEQMPELKALNWIDQQVFDESPEDDWKRPDLTLDDLSFIQYTSGSTAMPKGVMISYRNIIHNIYSIFDFRRHERSSESVYVNWAPIFHDMGLIMGVAQTAYDGIPTIMMTPVSFLQRPVRWLQAITDYKATISGGPNFAYDLCINKITPEERQTLDLSSWKIAFNGAEPVRPETLSRFVEVFGPHGFHPEALQPGYGMAETTLAVTGHYAKTPPVILPVNQDALEENRIVPAAPEDTPQLLVGCGPPLLDFEIAIVDPNTLEKCPPDHVGEIWLAADSVSVGYWERPEETKKTFQATIKDTGEGPFLRTGDLGFVRDNQLYITGRLKDMIIIKGRNYYPQDLELSAERSHPALEPGNGAAFSIRMDGTEQLIIVQEVKREARKNLDVQEVVNAIRKSIAKERGIRTYAVVLIRPHNVPKTSSGKIMRHESQNMFLKNEFEVIGEWRAPSQPPAK